MNVSLRGERTLPQKTANVKACGTPALRAEGRVPSLHPGRCRINLNNRGRSPLADVLTLPDTKQSLDLATAVSANVSCARCRSRWTPKTWSPQFVKDESDAFLECGFLAHGFLRLRCGDCWHDKLVAVSCKRRGFCPCCGARRKPRRRPTWSTMPWRLPTGTNSPPDFSCPGSLPRVPVRQWVLSLPIPPRLLLAAQTKLVTPALQVVHRAITLFLLDQAGLTAEQADSGAVTLARAPGRRC